MKRTVFLGLVVALIIGSCTEEKKSPIEGTWKLAFGKWSAAMYEQTFPTQIKGGQIRIYSKGYYVFTGRLQLDTTALLPNGGGSYTLEGNRFEELIMYREDKSRTGTKLRTLLEVRNDTLIQRWHVDETWKLAEKYNIEKYVRLE